MHGHSNIKNCWSSTFIRRIKDFTVIKLKMMRWEGHVACTGENIIPQGDLVRKPEGKRPVRRARNICEDNNKMDG